MRFMPRTNIFIDHRYQVVLILWPEALYDLESFVTTHNGLLYSTTCACSKSHPYSEHIDIRVRSRLELVNLYAY